MAGRIVLIAGATGLVGRAILEGLLRRAIEGARRIIESEAGAALSLGLDPGALCRRLCELGVLKLG